MARDVSRVLAIFPFEVSVYEEAGVPVEFIGHPLLDILPALDRDTARAGLASRDESLVGLLPGSRDAEVRRHLPVLLQAAKRIATRRPRTQFALATAPATPVSAVVAAVRAARAPVQVVSGEAHRVMAASDVLLVASGTATLEAACYGTPMVVLYRLSALSHALARILVRGVSHIGLPNIIAGREIVPELIQGRATPEGVAAAALRILTDDGARTAQRLALLEVRTRLGEAGAGVRAARAVLRERNGATAR
jgi:lipid-A-disaccharide synthase